MIRFKTTTLPLLTALALGCFALSPAAQALLPSPTPDGGYPNNNTAEGENALINLDVNSGFENTAVGAFALNSATTGARNTAVGASALTAITDGFDLTAIGDSALASNTSGVQNTAVGSSALLNNTTGTANTAIGWLALWQNNGGANTATGNAALLNNTTGDANTATGQTALGDNTTGFNNSAFGTSALNNNLTGNGNTGIGYSALFGNTGSHNIAVGENAGLNLTTGSNNIDIGNVGVAAEANTIRIGTQGTQTATFVAGVNGAAVMGVAVKVNAAGQIGTAPSSVRFKQNVKSMGDTSEALFALRPVTFRYKQEIDPEGIKQFGLVAEEVVKVDPHLVVRDTDGKPYSVRYEAVDAMLLNEFLKEHSKVEKLEATVAKQHKDFEAALADLKGQIQKVSAQLELNKPAPQTVVNNR